MEDKKWSLYFWLFRVNFGISAFTFGGGYVVIPMIRKYFVLDKGYITEAELMDMAAIAQSTPGAIAVNLSVLAGYKTARLKGAFISCLAAVIPPIIILSFISIFYQEFRSNQIIAAVLRGMEVGVAAVIVDLVLDMCKAVLQERCLLLSLIVAASFIAGFFLHVNVIAVLAVSCFLCFLRIWMIKRREGR